MSDRSVQVAWFKGRKDPDTIKAQLSSSKDILEILDQIIEDKKLVASSGRKPDFLDAGWPYKAADINGYLRALEEIQNLIPKP
jgi:hypothetical protein